MKTVVTRLVVLSVLLAGSALYVVRASATEPVPIRESFVSFPLRIEPGWHGSLAPEFDKKILDVLGVDEYLNRNYHNNRLGLNLYIGYYQSQRQGDTIHSPLNCLPGAGWEPVSHTYLPVQVSTSPGAPPTEIRINRYLIRKGLESQVVLYWYQSQGRVVANEYAGRFYMVLDALRSNRTDAAMVRVVVPMSGTRANAEREAEQAAVEFVKAMYPLLGRYLPA